MRHPLVAVPVVFIGALLVFYGVPGLIEWELVRHTSPWLACVALGDLLGCAFLFTVGLRRTAVALYCLASALEAYLLASHRVSAASLVWITNSLPAVFAAVLAAYLQKPDPSFLRENRRERR
ncbi:MAG TPA: hypothetical protein VKM93_00670 [Terriglobia bacterium]|nr:hypothetical protein [Terriglobia bacterium]